MLKSHSRIDSFKFAWQGIKCFFAAESNAKIHALAARVAIAVGWVLNITSLEWISVSVCIALVWITEAINTSIEDICDLISKDPDPRIKKIKDISAGAVLMSTILAILVGLIVFGKRCI